KTSPQSRAGGQPASNGGDTDLLDDVAHVAAAVPARDGRLLLAGIADRPHAQAVRAARRRPVAVPAAEREAPEVRAEPGLYPGVTAVRRILQLADAAAAVEGDAVRR